VGPDMPAARAVRSLRGLVQERANVGEQVPRAESFAVDNLCTESTPCRNGAHPSTGPILGKNVNWAHEPKWHMLKSFSDKHLR